MDILYTVEEKYLQALDEFNYGELPKSLQLFNEIIAADAEYARAYYHIGYLYHYHFKNFKVAGYYYKKCLTLEAEFPDVYEHYLKLTTTLKMHNLVYTVAKQALVIHGVYKSQVYEILGLYEEEELNFKLAKEHYKKAVLSTLTQTDNTLINDHLKRIADKQNSNKTIVYSFNEHTL